MTRAYNELYLSDAMDELGEMLDYAVNGRGLELGDFYRRFLASGIADAFGRACPKYLGGMSGIELAETVLESTGKSLKDMDYIPGLPYIEYWCGWTLAYLQWYTGLSFAYIDSHGFPIELLADMYYPLHEADVHKTVDIALGRIKAFNEAAPNPVKVRRKVLGLTQEELARRCGITLRMVQAYEQGRQDLARAEAATLLTLSRVLCCRPEELVNPAA